MARLAHSRQEASAPPRRGSERDVGRFDGAVVERDGLHRRVEVSQRFVDLFGRQLARCQHLARLSKTERDRSEREQNQSDVGRQALPEKGGGARSIGSL